MKVIEIGGKKRPFRFSLYAIQAYCELKKISLADFYVEVGKILKSTDVKNVGDVLYAGLIGGARREHIEVDFTSIDVMDWMDDEGLQSIPRIMAALNESMISDSKDKKKVKDNKK